LCRSSSQGVIAKKQEASKAESRTLVDVIEDVVEDALADDPVVDGADDVAARDRFYKTFQKKFLCFIKKIDRKY
jgi:hypothetical protein